MWYKGVRWRHIEFDILEEGPGVKNILGGEILLNAKYAEAHPHCSANILPKSNGRVMGYERNSNAFPCSQCHSSGFVWFCQPGWMSVTDFSRYGDSMAILLNWGLIMSINYAQGSASYRFVLVIISVTFVVWFINQSPPVWFTSLGESNDWPRASDFTLKYIGKT